jgi:MFS family permease
MMRPDVGQRRLMDTLTMFFVTGISLFLLLYVGYGEAQRVYGSIHIDKLVAQGRTVQSAMESYLRAGLPLKQYAGFAQLAEPIVASEDVAAIAVLDQDGNQLFINIDKTVPQLPAASAVSKRMDDGVDTFDTDGYYQVVLPLRSKFEAAGSLVVYSWNSRVTNRLTADARTLAWVALALSLAFAAFAGFANPYLARRRFPWLQAGYAVQFVVMAGAVVWTLVVLYSDAVEGKTKALADTLGQRLSDIVEFNLRFRDIDGLDKTFNEYRQLNPDIKEISLVIDGKVLIDTNPDRIGNGWQSDPHTYEYTVDLSRPDQNRRVQIKVATPLDVVYRQVGRSVKNFAALFIASAFLAGLFLQLAAAMDRLRADRSGRDSASSVYSSGEDAALAIVKPVFFVAVFLEHLTYSFLPHFMQDAAAEAGLSAGFASAPFMIYYLAFALTLVPAGHVARLFGPRPLMHFGLLLSGLGLLALVLPLNFALVVLARGVAGMGQAMLFIGVQSYILATASPNRRTQGAGIIVLGFQAGMISGMAIGSLLVTHIGSSGVFTICGALAFAMALYSLALVPTAPSEQSVGPQAIGHTLRLLVHDMRNVLQNGEFLRTMFLVGVPAKAVLTGIVTFGLPILLGRLGYMQEDIGQIIMLYAAGVIVASRYVSRMVDRIGKTEFILFCGCAISGAGLCMIGLMGWEVIGTGYGSTVFLIVGVIVVGVAHGFINAPVITHIADSELSTRVGANATTAAYRFLERGGHIAGPIVMGQLFLIGGVTPTVIAWCGLAVALFGLFFIMRGPSSAYPQEAKS